MKRKSKWMTFDEHIADLTERINAEDPDFNWGSRTVEQIIEDEKFVILAREERDFSDSYSGIRGKREERRYSNLLFGDGNGNPGKKYTGPRYGYLGEIE